jgi:hypothetical protein
MERPPLPQVTLGLALIAVGASGYFAVGLPDWLNPRRQAPPAQAPAVTTYVRHVDRQVSLELPSGWRWLAQKPDGGEADAAYFPISRFQGQNTLQNPVSLRVDGIPNAKHLPANEMLAIIAKGIDSKPEAIQSLKDLPPGMAGMTFPSRQQSRVMVNYVFVKPGGHLTYVLAIGSDDERFDKTMARHIAKTFQVVL